MDTKALLAEIYLRLDRRALLAELNPKASGDYLSLDCPFCKEKGAAYIYLNGSYITCNRSNNCGKKLSLWDYVESRDRSESKQAVLIKLAELANCSSLLGHLGSFDKEELQRAKDREDLLEEALGYFKAKLFSPAGEDTLGYLMKRGYSDEEIHKLELGYYPPQAELKKYLEAKGDLSLVSGEAASLFRPPALGDTHTLAIPYRDYTGRLKGFIVRSILPKETLAEKKLPKYFYNAGLAVSEQFFNMERNRGKATLIVVEGLLDALIMSERGFSSEERGVVAIGKATISEAQLDNAIDRGRAREFILALDRDTAGQGGTDSSLALINRKKRRGYVVTLPEGYKDPEELLRAQGADALRKVIDNPETAGEWKARRLLGKHSIPDNQGKPELPSIQRDRIIEEALAHEETLLDPIDSRDFIERICSGLGISSELLEPLRKSYHEKKARERLEKSYQKLGEDIASRLREDKVEEIEPLIKAEIPRITAQKASRIVAPYTLSELNQDLENAREGVKTGIPSLDARLTIPQEAITIIAGRPSHGKTTLLLNLFLNMVKGSPEKRFYFFSYEERRLRLAIKSLMIMSRKELDQYQNYLAFWKYLKAGKAGDKAIDKAQVDFIEYTDSGRLNLVYEPYNASDLSDTISYLADKYDNIGGIFIDYIQKIKPPAGSYSTRQIELAKISEKILETAIAAKLPILLGAQLGRPDKNRRESSAIRLDNLREAGDIEQDANLVLGLYNEAMAKAEEGKEEEKPEVKLELHILKNRDGEVSQKPIELTFNRPILAIEEHNPYR